MREWGVLLGLKRIFGRIDGGSAPRRKLRRVLAFIESRRIDYWRSNTIGRANDADQPEAAPDQQYEGQNTSTIEPSKGGKVASLRDSRVAIEVHYITWRSQASCTLRYAIHV